MSDTVMLIIGLSITFGATVLGSALVFFVKRDISPKLNSILLGFAAGIMIAATVWSLLIPSIEASEDMGRLNFLPAAVGLLIGALFLVLLDKAVPHIHRNNDVEEGPSVSLKKSTKMFLAVTIHNIPEGLAVGFAFGAAIGTGNAVYAALGLAAGIALQNFPEGAAVALPMRMATGSRKKAFLFGAGSGAVEPLAGIIGYFFAAAVAPLQPWLLAFAAGAMLFVVAEDLIPDAKLEENSHFGTWGVMIGFIVMMSLDVAFG